MLRCLARVSVIAAAILTSSSSRAWADPPFTDVSREADGEGSCRFHAASVARWTPALGSAARFVAEHAFRGDQGALIGLGVDDEGFWSTQTTIPDGCGEACASLDLVFTRFADGSATRYPLWRDADRGAADAHPETAVAARERVVLRRFWAYAGTVWPGASMGQDYALVTPAATPRADGLDGPPRYTGWLAAVVLEGRWRLRFTTALSPFMCWCQPTWASVARTSP